MNQFLIPILFGLFLSAQHAYATNYDCFVNEEGQENALGTMKIDTRSEEISFVNIDKYLYAACKGLQDSENTEQSFLACAYLMETSPTKLKLSLEHFRSMKTFRKTATETRSLVVVPENVGLLFHTYKRNARTFQLGCQLPE